MLMRGVILALAVGVLAGCGSCDWRFVTAEQRSRCLVMYSGEPGAPTDELWRWDPAKDPGLTPEMAEGFAAIDECKIAEGGRTILANASNGGVAAVDVATARAKWCARMPEHVAGPHSVDVLPDGRIAVANSTGVDALQIVDLAGHLLEPKRQRIVRAMDVAGAHGVVWDATRESLFVLGYTNLFELAYHPAQMAVSVKRRWDYAAACGDAAGHDLLPDGTGGYYFTNHSGVWRLNPDTDEFSPVLDVANVKSFSRDVEKGDLLSVPRERWWTDRLIVRQRDGDVRVIGPFAGARFYKARWMTERRVP